MRAPAGSVLRAGGLPHMLAGMDERTARLIGRRLVRWYGIHSRPLPWRKQPTPYRVWVSEVMLQQTVAAVVVPYFRRWVRRFPSIRKLAAASERDVLSAWEGMGYYRRARDLLAAARRLVREHGGRVPPSRAELLRLPGVGPYTASAIRSLAFGADEVALDANGTRVFMRLLSLDGSGSEAGVKRAVRRWAEAALPRGRSAAFNQALMDFGTLICRPRAPGCAECFLTGCCEGFQRGTQYEIPRRARPLLKKGRVAVAVFLRNGRVYLQKRPGTGLFAAMWEFPGGKVEKGETPVGALTRECREELGVDVKPGRKLLELTYRYTTFEVRLHAFLCRPPEGLPVDRTHRWVALRDLPSYPMPSANRRIVGGLLDAT